MQNQLSLIDTTPDADWRIDEPTRELGRRGIAKARAALAAAHAPTVAEAVPAARRHRSAA